MALYTALLDKTTHTDPQYTVISFRLNESRRPTRVIYEMYLLFTISLLFKGFFVLPSH